MLKQFAAILLIGILFFNWYGYQLLTAYWQQRAENRLEARLDKHQYDDDQLVSVKIPLTTLAYYNSSMNFERVNGRIEINGVHYNYVKRRIYGDSLELLCIPNTTAMNLQKAKNEFFRQVNDLQQQNQGKKNNSISKDFSKDYTPTAMDIVVPAALATLRIPAGMFVAPHLPSCYSPTAEMPPDQAPVLS
ncbi:MAG TPA: hypothetical protein VG605_02750 [Puia sp.]|nr:hypothetical protein [Puia sp.]